MHAALLQARERLGRRGMSWMTSDDMKVSKGLGLPVVAPAGVGCMPAKGEDEQGAARVFYVAAKRATQGLVIEARGWNRLAT